MTAGSRAEAEWIHAVQAAFAAADAFDAEQAWIDAAALPRGAARISVDAAVAGHHFPWPSERPHDCGWRAVAAALSDLAAVGATRKLRLVLSLAVGEDDLAPARVAAVDALVAGAAACLGAYGGRLVAGNVTRGPRLALHSTVLGYGAPPRAGRGPLQAGDLLWLCGTQGDAAAGLAMLEAPELAATDDRERLSDAYWRPTPKFDLGRLLWRRPWVVGVIDTSDGWARDFLNLVRPWGCGAVLDPNAVPRSHAWQRVTERSATVLRRSYWGGDDYALAFASRAVDAATAQRRLRRGGIAAACVGRVTGRGGVDWVHPPAVDPPPGFGYDPYF